MQKTWFLDQLDEALRIIELRRYRRILAAGRLPFVFCAAVFMVGWMLLPFFLGPGGLVRSRAPLALDPGWKAALLLVTCVAGAGVGAYLRVQTLWNQERRLHTFHTWLLSRQVPARAALTTIAMSALFGSALVAIPLVVGVGVALFSGTAWWQVLLYLVLTPLCAGVGGALGAAAFFVSHNLVRRVSFYPALIALAVLVLGLWLRIESVEKGWQRNWDEHPQRIVKAISLVAPVSPVYAASSPNWWNQTFRQSLGWEITHWQASLIYALLLAAVASFAGWVAVRGYQTLVDDPDALDEKPREVGEEAGEEFYWRGFRNPVWTRDIRTRLRSKDTAEFIFFASIAVAAGAFVPLVMTASDLSDPLQTARAAGNVFFWLTMTLVALVALVAPNLTSDVVTQERAQGSLEMLIATPMRPREILIGKLLGAVSVLSLLISPSLPLFGLCYLFHGADGRQVLLVYALVVVTMVVSAFIGLAQSSIWPKAGVAKFWAYGLTAIFVAFPGGPFWIAAAAAAPEAAMRQQLVEVRGISVVMTVVYAFGLALLWGNACEQLEYSEY